MVMPEHHGALVDRLVQETQPIRRLWSVRARWTVFMLLGVTAVALMAGTVPRPDLSVRIHEPVFTLGVIAIGVAAGFAALLALRNAVPGRSPSALESAVAVALVGAAALVTCAQPSVPGVTVGPSFLSGCACALRTVALALAPWLVLLVAIRRGAPVHVTSAGASAGAAALLLATAMLRVACPEDGAAHWLAWHYAPVALGALLSAAATSTWLATWRHR